MNIVYATRATIPYASAASINTVQMCEALSRLGHSVTLALGWKFWRWCRAPSRIWTYYGVAPCFRVKRFLELPKTGRYFDSRVADLAEPHSSLLYLRYVRMLKLALDRGVETVLELHSAPGPRQVRLIDQALQHRNFLGLVVITKTLRRHLRNQLTTDQARNKVFVWPDAVNGQRFADAASTADHAPETVGYVGSLFPGKGMEMVAAVAELVRDTPILVFGGRPREVARWARQTRPLENLQLRGHLPPRAIPQCMTQFGIALLPNQPEVRIPHGEDIGPFTSPLKLFEYMAAGKSIIASDLPNLREVLEHQRNCLLVPHADPAAWARAIRCLQQDATLRRRLANQARRDAIEKYSYETRFRQILATLAPALNHETACRR